MQEHLAITHALYGGNYHLTQQAPAHIQGGDIQGLSLIAQGSGGTGAQHVLRVDFRMANISGHYGPSKYLYAEALIYVEGYNCDPIEIVFGQM